MFNEILYRPLINIVVALYNTVAQNDFGLAIIILTISIRLVLLPLTLKASRSQKALNELQPEIGEIRKKEKDQTKQSQMIMALYKQRGVNPLSGCLPLLIQLPILWALYRVFLNVSKSGGLDLLYNFVSNPGTINAVFIGLIDLSVKNPVLAILAGLLQFVQAKLSMPSKTPAKTGNTTMDTAMSTFSTQMLYFFPVMIIIISWNLPAGLTLYWVTTTAFSVLEQLYIKKTAKIVK